MNRQQALQKFLAKRHYTATLQTKNLPNAPLIFSQQLVIKDKQGIVTAYLSLYQKNQILLMQAMPNSVVKELCLFAQQTTVQNRVKYNVKVQLPQSDFTVLKALFDAGLNQTKLQLDTESAHCLHHLTRQLNQKGGAK